MPDSSDKERKSFTAEEQKNALLPARICSPHCAAHYAINRKFQGIPGIAVTPKGTVYAVWYTGGKTEGPDNFCVIARSRDNGETWAEPLLVIEHPAEGIRTFDPNVWFTPDGAMYISWNQACSVEGATLFDYRGGAWMARCQDPEADLPVFDDPVRIGNGVMMNKPVFLSDGTWGFCNAVWRHITKIKGINPPTGLEDELFSQFTVSEDQGKTFVRRGYADVPDRGCDEHMVFVRKNGNLRMFVRTEYGIGQSDSADGGRTWTPGKNSGLGGANSRFYIRRLKSGRLLLINNVDDSGEDWQKKSSRLRHKMTVFLSDDDGETWPYRLLLEEGESTYPDAFEDRAGNIHIVYDHARYEGGFILYSRITEEDILSGTIDSENSVRSRIISSYPFQKEESKNK